MFRNLLVIVTLIAILTGCSGRSISNGISVLSGIAIVGTVSYVLLETVEETESSEDKSQLIVKEIKKATVGCHISEVIQKIGPPQNVASDEAGGKIYIWIYENNISVPQYSYVPVPQNNKPSEPFVPQIDPLKSLLNPEGTVTHGEMWYNPYFDRYEWKSKTHRTKGDSSVSTIHTDAINKGREAANEKIENSNSFVSGLKSREKIVTGHVTERHVVKLMFFINSESIIYHVLYQD